MKRIALTCLVLGSVVLTSGCALALTRPPPGNGPLPEGTCSTSVVLPALDSGMGVLFGITTVGVLVAGEDEDYVSNELAGAVFGLAAAAWGYSAYKGFEWTSECRLRQALSEQAIADHPRTLGQEGRPQAEYMIPRRGDERPGGNDPQPSSGAAMR